LKKLRIWKFQVLHFNLLLCCAEEFLECFNPTLSVSAAFHLTPSDLSMDGPDLNHKNAGFEAYPSVVNHYTKQLKSRVPVFKELFRLNIVARSS
jgi:hypothetical protein